MADERDVLAREIDEELRRVIEANYQRCKDILTTNLEKLHAMAEALVKYETIDDDQIKDIMAGRPPRPPSGWDENLSNKPPKAPADGTQPGTLGSPAGQH